MRTVGQVNIKNQDQLNVYNLMFATDYTGNVILTKVFYNPNQVFISTLMFAID